MRAFGFVAMLSLLWPAGLLRAQDADAAIPELSLADAIQIAVVNNRPVKIALLDVTKSQWQVAAAKSKRFPAISTYFFGAGNLTSPSFTIKKDQFGLVDNMPVPAQNTKISLSQGFTGYVVAEVAQPLSQLYRINLAVREQELETDLSKQKYEGKRQSLVADVKQAYYAVLQTES